MAKVQPEFLAELRPHVNLYRHPVTGIAWVADGTSGTASSAHPNIVGTGNVAAMKSRGFWAKGDHTIRSHGFIYNVDRIVASDPDSKAALAACRCVGCSDRKANAGAELYEVVTGMMHDIEIFYHKHRDPGNKHYLALKAALAKAEGRA